MEQGLPHVQQRVGWVADPTLFSRPMYNLPSLPIPHPLHILTNRPSPILLIIPHSNVPLKTRPPPIRHPLHQAVFRRIILATKTTVGGIGVRPHPSLARQVAGRCIVAVAFRPVDAHAADTNYEGVFC